MLKKSLLLISVLTSTQTFCEDNSFYTTIQKYVTLQNGFGVCMFALGGYTIKKASNNYCKAQEYSNEFKKKINDRNWDIQSIQPIYNSYIKDCTIKTYLWGSVSLTSLAVSLYFLKSNFY